MAALIELENVFKIYQSGDTELFALNDLTLTIQAGESVAIMGESGSGKSTLMNILGALDRPTKGAYRLDGESVEELNDTRLSALRNQKIGFVFQSFNLLPRMSALENVEVPLIYGRVPSAERKARAKEALTQVGLGERMDHLPTQLSGGQQQRVAIARALVTKPLLLLADEPTGALDSETTAQILDLLEGLHKQGLSLVMVTHEGHVGAHADRVIMVRDGKILADGPPEDILPAEDIARVAARKVASSAKEAPHA